MTKKSTESCPDISITTCSFIVFFFVLIYDHVSCSLKTAVSKHHFLCFRVLLSPHITCKRSKAVKEFRNRDVGCIMFNALIILTLLLYLIFLFVRLNQFLLSEKYISKAVIGQIIKIYIKYYTNVYCLHCAMISGQ